MSAEPRADTHSFSISRSLSSAFNLRPGEQWPVGMLLLHSFCLGLGQALLYIAANAMFLKNHDASMLSYIFIGGAIVNIVLSFGLDVLQRKLPVQRLLPTMLVFVSAVTLTLCVMAWVGMIGEVWYFSVMIWFYVVVTMVNIEAMTLPGLIFDIRQAKRLLGLVTSGEIVANIMGNFLVPLVLIFLDILWLVAFSAAMYLIGTFVLFVILRRYKAQPVPVSHGKAEEDAQGSLISRDTFRDSYVMKLCLIVFLSLTVNYYIDFAFLRHAQGDSPDAEDIAAFLGLFLGIGESLNFVIKTFFSGRILNRFGVRVSLSVLPSLLILGMVVGGILTPIIGYPAAIGMFVLLNMQFDTVFRSSVQDSSFAILFQPLKPHQRLTAQTLTQGIVDPVSLGLAGISLIFISNAGDLGTNIMLGAMAIATITWLIVTRSIHKDYTAVLLKAMKGRVLDGGSIDLKDPTSRKVLMDKLKSPLVGEVLYALDILEKHNDDGLAEAVIILVEHPIEAVRIDVIERAARMKLAAAIPIVARLMEEAQSSRVRAAAIKAYCSLYEEDAVDKATAYLDDEFLDVQIGAMTGLLRNGGIDGILVAGDRLIKLGSSYRDSERRMAARIIGEVGVTSFYRPLRDLMNDAEPHVQDEAMYAAGRIKNPRLLPVLIEGLTRPHVHAAAASAIASFGTQALSALETVYEQHHTDTKMLIRTTRIAGRIRGAGAVALLKGKITSTPEPVRNQVLVSLNLCQFRATEADEEFVVEEIRREISYAYFFYGTQIALEGADAPLLRDALKVELNELQSRIFYLLSFLYDPRSIFRARDNLLSPSREHRAFALEMLDTEITNEIKRSIFPVVEEATTEERVERLEGMFGTQKLSLSDRLRALLDGPENHVNAWTKSCAIRAGIDLKLRELLDEMDRLIVHPESYVRETALRALHALDSKRYVRAVGALSETDKESFAPIIIAVNSQQPLPMLLTLEKVIILKTVEMFSETPDDVLVEVASILEEETAAPGQQIIKKGDVGNCMYIIHEGRVRIHDGDITYAERGAREFFGEFSLLDNETRSASITAIDETVMLRLDQEAFYEIMSDRIEVARGIIRQLTKSLRRQNETLMKLRRGEK